MAGRSRQCDCPATVAKVFVANSQCLNKSLLETCLERQGPARFTAFSRVRIHVSTSALTLRLRLLKPPDGHVSHAPSDGDGADTPAPRPCTSRMREGPGARQNPQPTRPGF